MQNLLNKILSDNRLSHAQLAKDIGISKSYLLFMLNGQKPMTEKIYVNMLSVDYITPYTQQLSDSYFRQKFGNAVYELMQYFMLLAREFTFSPKVAPQTADIPDNESCITVSGNQLIGYACRLLKNAAENNENFYTNYPFTFEELDDALYSTALSEKINAELIKHTVALSGNMDKSSVLSYWRGLKWGYTGTQTKCCFSPLCDFPLPYFIVCGDRILMFSDNLMSGSLIHSADMAEIFIRAFKEHKAYDFIKYIADETVLLTSGCMMPTGRLRSIENALCTVDAYDYDMLLAASTDGVAYEVKDTLIKAYLNYYSISGRIKQHIPYFMQEAFEDWLKNGIEYNVSSKYLKPFSVDARKLLLKRLNNKDNWKMIKKGTIQLPKGYTFDDFDNDLYTHFMLTPYCDDKYEVYCEIPKSKVRGLSDFLDAIFCYIDLETIVYTTEERKNLLSQMIILGEELKPINK